MTKLALILFLVAIIASSLAIAGNTQSGMAQTTPSVPEFTLKFVDRSYDVPPTYGVDQYTGKTVITQSGYHQENKSIEVSIKNQPFAAYADGSGHFISLHYNFTFKGHYGDNWKTYRAPHYWGYVNASRSDYTVTSFPLQSSEFSNVPAGGQVDFRVEALTGYQTTTMVPTPWGPGYTYEFTGESSGWSNIQTITLPEASTPSPTPTLIVGLSESASALNYGVEVNFTATAEGGIPPYTFNWYVDNQSSANGSSPYFSIDTMPVGSHHVYVLITDADGNSATTNTVEFNVLPTSNLSPSPSNLSPSPTIPEFPLWLIFPVAVIATLLAVVVVKTKKRSAYK